MGLDGKFEGKVTAAAWAKYDKENGTVIPYLKLNIQIAGTAVESSIWFDTDLVERGRDKGQKTNAKAALELLASYGIKCNAERESSNDPSTFPAQLVGKTLRVFCDTKGKDGAQRCFINANFANELDAGEIKAIWSEMFAGKPAATKAKPPEPPEEKEELPF